MQDNGTTYDPPAGLRFSQLYLDRGEPSSDSRRLRVRIGGFARHELNPYRDGIRAELVKRIGAEFEYFGLSTHIEAFLKQCQLRDFHDSITVIYDFFTRRFQAERSIDLRSVAAKWLQFTKAAFIEENVAYRVDDRAVVRPLIDTEFLGNVESLIRGLDDPRLSAVRAEIEKALQDIDAQEPDPKAAVRAIFEGIEIYAKLVVAQGAVQRLNREAVERHLLPLILARYQGNAPAIAAAKHMANSLLDWIAAAHVYRHGQRVPQSTPPPVDLAVAFVSSGVAFLRWLLDNTRHALLS